MIRTAALSACRMLGAVSVRAVLTTTNASTCVAPSLSRALATANQLAEEQAIKWRFPVDDRMQSMMASVENGLSQTTILTFNSKAPITRDLMEEALIHAYDNIESLRQCIRLRHGQLWLADMPRRKLDFQVVSGTDLEEKHSAIRRLPFNMHEGPLWKAWLMPCPADASCAIPDVKAAFPHQCHLLISINHAFNDGAVVLAMGEMLLRIIDNLLVGAPVDIKPIGELRDGVEAREEENRIRAELESDPEKLLAALRKHAMNKCLPLLIEAYGVPNEANLITKYLEPVVLDSQLTEKLTAKCRSMGATLNACFAAVLNISLIELASEAGLKRDVYKIYSRHPVDSRRLMNNWKSLPLGFHVIPFTHYTYTPHDAKKNFWQYVKKLDNRLRENLKSNYMCEQRVLEALTRPKEFTYEDLYAIRHSPACDYLFSNLYSAKNSKKQCIGKNVQITYEGNYMGIHNESCILGYGVFVSRGQPRVQHAYSAAAVHERVASRCREKTISILHDVAKMVH